MRLDAPEVGGGERQPPELAQDHDAAHRHLEALLADAAQLAEDDKLDDRSWAEIIVRMVYSTSALRHLAGRDGEAVAPAMPPPPTAPPAAKVEVPDLPPPRAEALLATEEPQVLDLTVPAQEKETDSRGLPAPDASTRSADRPPLPLRTTGAGAGQEPQTPVLAPEAHQPGGPYIPDSRWRRRRGRHRLDRPDHDYDYFQDLRRVLDELEAAEATKAEAVSPAPPPVTAEDAPPAIVADVAPLEPTATHTADPSAPVVEPDPAPTTEKAGRPAPAPGDRAQPDARPEPQNSELAPPNLKDLVAASPVPFDEFRRGVAALDVEEPAPLRDLPSSRSVSFQDLTLAFARLNTPAEPTRDHVAAAPDAPTPPVDVADTENREGGPSEKPAVRPPDPAAEHRSGGGGSTSPWAEHMLLGALVVVAARRPARWFVRALSGD